MYHSKLGLWELKEIECYLSEYFCSETFFRWTFSGQTFSCKITRFFTLTEQDENNKKDGDSFQRFFHATKNKQKGVPIIIRDLKD